MLNRLLFPLLILLCNVVYGRAPVAEIIDANHYIHLLGKSYEQTPIQAIKERFGAKRPEMDYEDARAHWYFYDTQGVDFVFADEAIFKDKEARDIGDGEIYLTGVNFYSGSECNKFDDSHVLPFEVQYRDTYEQLIEKMKKAGTDHKIVDPKGENSFALKRADGKRYAISFTIAEYGVESLTIRFYHGQDYLSWMD